MENEISLLVSKAVKTADSIRSAPGTIRIVSHYDADGITSAAIMATALFREGKEFHISLVKQLSEDIIKDLADSPYKSIMFLDLGSGMLSHIQEHLLDRGKRVIVADHHQVQGEAHSPNMSHLNPVNFGITENVSGSGTTYLLARALSPANKDTAEFAIVGAIGDSQMGSIGPDWGLFGLNREILKDAESAGKIRVEKGLRIWGRESRPIHKALEYSMDPYIPGISGSESGAVHFLQETGIELKKPDGSWRTLSDLSEKEKQTLASGIIKERIRNGEENPDWIFGDVYELLDKTYCRDANEFATLLNASGKMKKGHVGIALCMNDPKADEEVKDLLKAYRREIGKALSWANRHKKDMKITEKAEYLIAGDSIDEHIISNVVSIISRSGPDTAKPVFAFVNTEEGNIKVSARASDGLVKAGLNLKEIVSAAAEAVNGEGGGHSGAAGATIPGDSLDEFISVIENSLNGPETNINTETERDKIDSDGREKNEGNRGTEGNGTEERAAPGEESKAGAENQQKNEGKGLVRYLGSGNV